MQWLLHSARVFSTVLPISANPSPFSPPFTSRNQPKHRPSIHLLRWSSPPSNPHSYCLSPVYLNSTRSTTHSIRGRGLFSSFRSSLGRSPWVFAFSSTTLKTRRILFGDSHSPHGFNCVNTSSDPLHSLSTRFATWRFRTRTQPTSSWPMSISSPPVLPACPSHL